ncbi:MAG TPA: hypothetical protein VFF68_01665, partial [Anaerolineaceae bacterium]|nr:hypothetical protein [Anaerolineaceae bacterium]
MSKNHSRLIVALLLIAILFSACKMPAPPATPRPAGIAPEVQPGAATATYTPVPTPTVTPTPIPLMRNERGERALFMGDYEGALAEFREAFNGSTDQDVQAAALVGQGRTYYEWENYSLALSTLKQVVSAYPDSPALADA